MRLSTLLSIVLLVGACAETTSFQPTENVSAVGHGGQPAAGYDIGKSEGGAPYVHVNVWSAGTDASNGRTRLTFAFTIRDTGRLPVALDRNALQLKVYDTSGALLPQPVLVQLQAPNAATAVGPNASHTIHAVFVMPLKVAPSNIGSIELRWGLIRQDGVRYTQFTQFQQTPDYYAYAPTWGFYDPFFYNPWYWWGPGYGYRLF
jgi:hypothetical protein